MNRLILLAISLLSYSTFAFEVISGPETYLKYCTTETTSEVFTAKAHGACSAVEYIYTGFEEYDVDFEKSFLLTESDHSGLRQFVQSLREEKPEATVKIESSKNCRQLELSEFPYVFLTDDSYCETLGFEYAGGCFAQEVNPGFDMPDSYIAPDHLPENPKFLEEAELEITVSTEVESCN